MSLDDSVNEVVESILTEHRLKQSLGPDSREDVEKWVRRVDLESRRFAEELVDLEPDEDRDRYYTVADTFYERVCDLRESDAIAFLASEVVRELDELISQLDNVGGVAGGVVLDLEPEPTRRNPSSQSSDDDELAQIYKERAEEMIQLARKVRGLRKVIRESGTEDV